MRRIRDLLCRLLLLGLWVVPAGPSAAWAATLSADDNAAITRVEDYLNRLSSLYSRFIQVNSYGAFAEGELFLVRPGQLRFEYDSPHPTLMIADGSMLLFYNKNLKQASFVPLSKTPLRFLTSKQIRLTDDAEVTAVEQGKASLSVTLRDRSGGFDGSLTLVFGDRPLELRKWEIIDEKGVVIEVALMNPRFGAKVDRDVFDYSHLDVYNTKTLREDGR